jgi:hypothetical protein
MKKLLLLSLTLLSLTVNAWKWNPFKKQQKVTLFEESKPTNAATGKPQIADKQSKLQRFKNAITPGGPKTQKLEKPFKAIGASVKNSYGTLKDNYGVKGYKITRDKQPIDGEHEPTLLKETLDVKEGRGFTEKAQIVLTKGTLGAAAPFHAIKTQVQNAWQRRQDRIAAKKTGLHVNRNPDSVKDDPRRPMSEANYSTFTTI